MQRRRKRSWPWILLSCLLLAVGIGAGAWALWPRSADRSRPSALAPEGAIHGLYVPLSQLTGAQHDVQATLERLVESAEESGMNAIFLEVYDGTAAAFRQNGMTMLPDVSAGDTLLHKYDPLAQLCRLADEKGLSVYACAGQNAFADAEKSADALQETAAYLLDRYAVAAVYTLQADGAFVDCSTQQPLLLARDAAFANPSLVFLASVADDWRGAAVDWALAQQNPDAFGLIRGALQGDSTVPTLLHYTPSEALAITYPAEGAALDTATCFVMGTSNPQQPLLLDGAPIDRTTDSGVFGTLVELAVGENTFSFAQGDVSVVLHVTRNAPPTGSSGGGTLRHDDTVQAEPGQIVVTTGYLTSLLSDPSSNDAISETVPRGTAMRVKNSVETTRNGKRTWAYQLISGDYVLAGNVSFADSAAATFTSAASTATTGGEMLTFAGEGAPLVYGDSVGNTLVLHLYDTQLDDDFVITNSLMVKQTKVAAMENGTQLTLTFDAPLWGFTLVQADGGMQLYLKQAPVRAADATKPLTGVTVLLDAGHGADDSGAMGVAGSFGPVEKDVNLAVVKAAKYRLEELGATVQTVRTDDTFLTLEERNALITQTQPDFFLAIHHNSLALMVDANNSTGTECYYFYDSGKALAETLVSTLSQRLNRTNRGAMWDYYYVTRNNTCPAVLLEVGFMVNPAEYEQVTDTAVIWDTGDAIAMSILQCTPQADG